MLHSSNQKTMIVNTTVIDQPNDVGAGEALTPENAGNPMTSNSAAGMRKMSIVSPAVSNRHRSA